MYPTKAIGLITLEEHFIKYKHNLVYLRVFGCMVYYHISSILRNKLYSKALHTFFIGYNKYNQTYCYYDPLRKKIIIYISTKTYDFCHLSIKKIHA